ncbi:hypothetical protein [Bosea sp. 124]|uniref:hypothetical protein n=1 Tax=Bosea sp. 124 TaxID=2135642 RepID=UPI0020C106CE|nr:hypothetical protein [Bosea sp. 124]
MFGEDDRPRWVRDLVRFLPLKSQFVLTGNVRDLQIRRLGEHVIAQPMTAVLTATLVEAGYGHVIGYDPLAGFSVLSQFNDRSDDADAILTRLGLTAAGGRAPAGPDLFGITLERLVGLEGSPVALVVDFAARLTIRPEALSAAEHQLFTRALVLGQTASARPLGPDRAPRFNAVIWLADKEGDLPDWLTIGNPRLRHISVAPPDRAARRAVAPSLVRGLPGAKDATSEAIGEAEDDIVDATEGMLLSDLSAVIQLARTEVLRLPRFRRPCAGTRSASRRMPG